MQSETHSYDFKNDSTEIKKLKKIAEKLFSLQRPQGVPRNASRKKSFVVWWRQKMINLQSIQPIFLQMSGR
jgi:hypothetical protein